MFNQFLTCDQDDYTQISQDIRKIQNNLLERRLRRPFFSGMTTSGLNYIDTRPIDNNKGTILSKHEFHPTIGGDKEFQDPLPHHISITQSPSIYSSREPATGITLVLAHGFSQGLSMWTENFDYFSSIPGVSRVVAFDWRGMGGSERNIADIPKRSALTFFEQYTHHDLSNQAKKKEREDKCGKCSLVQKGKDLQQRLRDKYNNYGLGDSLPPIAQPDPMLSPQSDQNHLRLDFQTHNLQLQQKLQQQPFGSDIANTMDPEETVTPLDNQEQKLTQPNQPNQQDSTIILPHIPTQFLTDSIRKLLYPITAYSTEINTQNRPPRRVDDNEMGVLASIEVNRSILYNYPKCSKSLVKCVGRCQMSFWELAKRLPRRSS
jgi:hypothetical protein